MMVDTKHVLEQMRSANPVPSLEDLSVDDHDLVRQLVDRRRSAMTTPLKDQLRQVPPEEPAHRTWVRPVLVVGLATVIVLAVVGVSVFFSGGDGDVEPAGPPTTHAVAWTAIEMPSVPFIGPEWGAVSAVLGYGSVESVVAAPDGFIAVGEICRVNGCRAVIWRSADGYEWSRTFDGPVAEVSYSDLSALFAGLYDIVVNDRGFLAAGGNFSWGWGDFPGLAFSADGITWEQIRPVPEGQPAGSDSIQLDVYPLSMVADDDGFLMAGQSCEYVDDSVCRGVIWRSEDGIVWTKVLEDVRDSTFVSIERVAGYYLAVGGAGDDLYGWGFPLDGAARIWRSFDGITWNEISSDSSVFSSQYPDRTRDFGMAAAELDTGYLVSGRYSTDPEGPIWFSEDGTSWELVPTPGVFVHATITDLAASGDRVIAVGSLDGHGAAWRSDDGGTTWERVHDVDAALTDHGSRFTSVAIRDDTAVAGISTGGQAGIWVFDLNEEG